MLSKGLKGLFLLNNPWSDSELMTGTTISLTIKNLSNKIIEIKRWRLTLSNTELFNFLTFKRILLNPPKKWHGAPEFRTGYISKKYLYGIKVFHSFLDKKSPYTIQTLDPLEQTLLLYLYFI